MCTVLLKGFASMGKRKIWKGKVCLVQVRHFHCTASVCFFILMAILCVCSVITLSRTTPFWRHRLKSGLCLSLFHLLSGANLPNGSHLLGTTSPHLPEKEKVRWKEKEKGMMERSSVSYSDGSPSHYTIFSLLELIDSTYFRLLVLTFAHVVVVLCCSTWCLFLVP